MKFKAPLHVTGIFTSGFEIRADENGVAELPEGAGSNVIAAMEASGWERVEDDAGTADAGKPQTKPADAGAGKPAKPGEPSDQQPPA